MTKKKTTKKKTKKETPKKGPPGAYSVVATKTLAAVPATIQAHLAWRSGCPDCVLTAPAPPALGVAAMYALSTLPDSKALPYGVVVDLSKLKPKTKFLAFFFTEPP